MTEYVFPIDQYDSKEYIFFPACAYNGNRFKSVKRNYPPFYTKEEMTANMPVIITDVPRLNPDGSGVIEITSGDVSVYGHVFKRAKKRPSYFHHTADRRQKFGAVLFRRHLQNHLSGPA